MLIVDSQVHIRGADTPERAWRKRAEAQHPVPLGENDLLRVQFSSPHVHYRFMS